MAVGDEIVQWIKAIRERGMEKRTLCPLCEYPIDEKEDGMLYCTFCGWTDSLTGRRKSIYG